MQKVGRKARFESVVIPIYTAYCAMAESKSGTQFLADRDIKAHGNTKNEFYPYFLAFTKAAHPWLRDSLCKYAAVAALARLEEVPPQEFGDWLKTHPIEKACAEYRLRMCRLRKMQHDIELRRINEFLVDPKKNPDQAPILSATPITSGYAGLKLAVLDFTLDGRGDFRVLGILPHDRAAVLRIVAAAANAAAG